MSPTSNPLTPWEANFVFEMRRLRENKGLTQTDLARLVKGYGLPFHQPTIARIESGARPIRLDEAFAISQALDARLDTMVSTEAPDVRSLRSAVDRMRREAASADTSIVEMVLHEYFERFQELGVEAARFVDSADPASTGARWAAAWVIKALAAGHSIIETVRLLQGLWLDGERDWRLIFGEERPPYETFIHDMEELLAQHEDTWSQRPDEHPAVLADLNPAELYLALPVGGEDDSGEPDEAS